jgi:hypothetical protein
MFNEVLDRIVTYGTPAFLIVKDLLKKLVRNPELQAEAAKKLVEVAKGGRTRGDEMLFLASLVSFKSAAIKDKQIFLDKHYELLHPEFTGKDELEVKALKKKKALAKGMIFLISEDLSCTIPDPDKPLDAPMFQMAHNVWKAVFMGIRDISDDTTKLQIFEKRIMHFGKNHQEGKTLKQFMLSGIGPTWDKVNSVAETVGDGITSVTDWINRQYDEREDRAAQRRFIPFWQRLRPDRLWRAFLDQF